MQMGWRPWRTKQRFGSASDVPCTTMGRIGLPVASASSKAPGLKARMRPLGERVPSGNIMMELPSARVSWQRRIMAATLSRSPRMSSM